MRSKFGDTAASDTEEHEAGHDNASEALDMAWYRYRDHAIIPYEIGELGPSTVTLRVGLSRDVAGSYNPSLLLQPVSVVSSPRAYYA